MVQANADSFSDVNLVPEQWWPTLRGEGITKHTLNEPIVLEWGIGDRKTRLEEFVELSVQIAGWEDPSNGFVSKFYLSKNDGDALTLGYPMLRHIGVLPVLEPLIESQRQLGLLLVCPSPEIDPTIRNMNGVDVPLVDPLIFGETDDQYFQKPEAVCARPLQILQKASAAQQSARDEEVEDEDFIDPATYDGKGPFIGRKSLLFLKQELMDSGVFVDTLPLGGSTLEPMEIVLRDDFEPAPVKGSRRYSPAVMTALEEEIEKQLALGVIEECDDVPVQEVVMVKKSDSASGYRFCIDARGVNKGVVVKPYALPPIAEILAGTAGCQYFARFDLISSYWQYPLAVDSKRHTAFRALGKVYRYTRVPMGSIGASFHVQRSNVKILGNLYGDGVGVYIDDTPIHAVTLERFVEIIRMVVKKFAEAKLYCKASKCDRS